MKPVTSLRWTIGAAAAAVSLLAAMPAMAQARQFTPGTDCSKVPQNQQVDCRMQNEQNSTMVPSPTPPVLPGGNGMGTNQNGTLGGSGQTGGSSSGAGGGNGGASPPGQSGN